MVGMIKYRWYLFVKDPEVQKNLIEELKKALEEVDCRNCKVFFSWDPAFQEILHVEVHCPTLEDVKACDNRIKIRLIEECEKRNVPHTIGDYRILESPEQ
jgi:hypothetical protein